MPDVGPLTVDTSTSTSALGRRPLDVTSKGVKWVAIYNGSNTEFWYTTNNTAWTQDTTGGTLGIDEASIFIDRDDFIHVAGMNGNAVTYYRGTPNTAHTSWTWSAARVPASASVQSHPMVIAHREGSGWMAHIVWSRYYTTSSGYTEYRCRCQSSGVFSIDNSYPECGSLPSHGHTSYTSWSTSSTNCSCGNQNLTPPGCHSWQFGWHNTYPGVNCSHIHSCSSGTQESRFISTGTSSHNYVYYARYQIASNGSTTTSRSATTISSDYGRSQPTRPVLDFTHTGDTRTVKSSTPDIFITWTTGSTGTNEGVKVKRLPYSTATWPTSGTEYSIDTTEDPDHLTACWDGDRFLIALEDATAPYVKVYERDSGNTVTTTRTAPTIGGAVGDVSITYDSALKDIYLVASDSSSDARMAVYDRSASQWSTWETIETTTVRADQVSTKIGDYSGSALPSIGLLYLAGAASPYDVRYFVRETNEPPSAPTWTTVSGVKDVNSALTLDWVFEDINVGAGDTQSAYTVRRFITQTEYWNGSSWQLSEDGTTKVASATTELALSSGWGTDGDAQHRYAVKTWDSFDAGPSTWGAWLDITPSAKDNPTLTAPTGTVGVTNVTATWTVTTQTKYRIWIYGDNGGAIDTTNLIYDSGEIVSANQQHPLSFPTNSVTRWVRLRTWNDEGLASDFDDEQITVSYTPPDPASVTLSIFQDNPGNIPQGEFNYDIGILVSIDNPATVPEADENDIYRREGTDMSTMIRVAAGMARDSEFEDYAVASGVDYQYMVRAFSLANGTSSDSSWVS